MVTIQAQIQVGPSHQARLPPIQDSSVQLCESHEDLVWKPDSISDVDLLMYLRASRSMAAFVGWCDGGSTDDGCAAASMDETTINSLQLLHDNSYDTGRALQALVKVINPKSVDRRWSDEDAKRFVRGLKQHGKNFFKIRRDVLPGKSTADLVEYYYLWKKLSSTSRPPTHRRRRVLRRQPPTPPTPPSSESVEEPTSPSDPSDNEIESDEAVDYVCGHCHATQSTTWFEVSGKPGAVICASCKSFRRTGDTGELPPYVFRPVKEEGQPVPDTDQPLDSVSSGSDESPETANSEECCPAVDRVTPSTSSSCSSQADVPSQDKSCQPGQKSSSPVVSVKLEGAATADPEFVDSVSCLTQPCKPMPCKIDSAPELWKVPDINSGWQQPEKPTSAATDRDFTEPVYKKELKESVEQLPMMPLFKVEDAAAEVGDTASSHWSDIKSMQLSRAIASVAPCPSSSASPWKSGPGSSSSPPRHSTTTPLLPVECDAPTAMVRNPAAPYDASHMMFEEQSDDSDMDTRQRSPSPQLQPINEQFRSSKNAIFVRRWFRGRNTCCRCDVEFSPVPGSVLAAKREASYRSRQTSIKASSSNNASAPSSSSSSAIKDNRHLDQRTRKEAEDQRKKNRTPPENRSFDAQITSTLMSMQGMDMPPGVPRAPVYPPFGPSPTPALQKLSEYIRPHNNPVPEVQRYMPYGPPPVHPQGMDPYMRMAGPLPCLPGSWDGVEKREREAVFEREMREMEMMDKMRHEMAAHGLDRLLSMGPPNPLDAPAWEELQRIYGSLALGALQPGLAMGMPPGVFPVELMQRERERIDMLRNSQEQQQQLAAAMAAANNRDNAAVAAAMAAAVNNRDVAAAMAAANSRENAAMAAAMAAANSRENAAVAAAMAAANNREMAAAMAAANGRDNAAIAAAMAAAGNRDNAAAVFQLFQKYSQDPVMLQRHLLALSSSKDQEMARMMDASSLIYHFARADPLAGAAGAGNGAPVAPPNVQQQQQQQQQSQHFPVMTPPQQDMMALAQHYERVYLEMLSRPPYNSDPALAQQLMLQMSAQHEAMRHQMAFERDNISSQQPR